MKSLNITIFNRLILHYKFSCILFKKKFQHHSLSFFLLSLISFFDSHGMASTASIGSCHQIFPIRVINSTEVYNRIRFHRDNKPSPISINKLNRNTAFTPLRVGEILEDDFDVTLPHNFVPLKDSSFKVQLVGIYDFRFFIDIPESKSNFWMSLVGNRVRLRIKILDIRDNGFNNLGEPAQYEAQFVESHPIEVLLSRVGSMDFDESKSLSSHVIEGEVLAITDTIWTGIPRCIYVVQYFDSKLGRQEGIMLTQLPDETIENSLDFDFYLPTYRSRVVVGDIIRQRVRLETLGSQKYYLGDGPFYLVKPSEKRLKK